MSEQKPKKRYLSIIIFTLLGLLGVLVVLYAWQLPPFTSSIISTENAYIRGKVTVISPQVSGYVTQVNVQDFQQVKKGDHLLTIDQRIYLQQLNQAKARLAASEANLKNSAQSRQSALATIAQSEASISNAQALVDKAQKDLNRINQLAGSGAVSQQELDQYRVALKQAQANLLQTQAALQVSQESANSVDVNKNALLANVSDAKAAVELAQINLNNTQIIAPEDGQLGQINVRLGQFASAGTQLLAIVPQQIWIIANFKETQLNHVQLGQTVKFTVDALDDQPFTGTVQNISPAAGSEFSVLPADNATGNFVKIPQRLAVRININPQQKFYQRLRPGMSVQVHVDTASSKN